MDGEAQQSRERGCMANALAIVTTDFAMPALLAAASPKTRKRVLEAPLAKSGENTDKESVQENCGTDSQLTPPCRQAARKKATLRVTCGPISARSGLSFSPNSARISNGM
jgi:hypothetical protein